MAEQLVTEKPRRTEEEITREYINNLLRDLRRKKLTSVLLAVVFALLGVFALGYALPMVAYCCLMIVLIAAIRYWDAAGHMDEVRRRPTKFLHAPMWVLDPKAAAASGTKGEVQG